MQAEVTRDEAESYARAFSPNGVAGRLARTAVALYDEIDRSSRVASDTITHLSEQHVVLLACIDRMSDGWMPYFTNESDGWTPCHFDGDPSPPPRWEKWSEGNDNASHWEAVEPMSPEQAAVLR